ncbi:MAG: insulinase family protein, partial [Oscillospiraceae bacterium]|nr:insulinase family protein [Oscillospiraceae bacterium]
QVNAYTSNGLTCFHGRVVDTRLGELAEVLGDITQNSKLDDADVESERLVIGEEIDMYEDSPENLVSEKLLSAVYDGSALGRSILGTRESLNGLSGEKLRGYMKSRYVGGATVVALAGSYSDADFAKISDIFSRLPAGEAEKFDTTLYKPGVTAVNKDIEQVHLALAFPGVDSYDARRFALGMLSDILGGGMSSRLFQEVREKRGLCYSIYSQSSSFADTGIFTVNTATNAESQAEMLRVITEEIRRILDFGVTEDELRRERELVEASVLMSLESSSARMSRVGNNEMTYGRVPTPDEIIARYEAVTAEDIAALAAELFRPELMSASVVGKGAEDANALDIPIW